MNRKFINFVKKVVPYNTRILLRKLNWKTRYYLGYITYLSNNNNVYCPIAKKNFRHFVTIDNDLVTPTNGARSRHRLVWLYLENELNILKSQLKVLHIAPELSIYNVLKNIENIEYTPGDKQVDGYSNQNGILNIDLIDLNFPDNSFDCIIANQVLEHIQDDIKAMKEIYRVLKPGGTAIITVPINEDLIETYENPEIILPKDREKHFGQWDHVRWYGLDIKDRLENVGLKVTMNKYAREFSQLELKKYGIRDEILIITNKY